MEFNSGLVDFAKLHSVSAHGASLDILWPSIALHWQAMVKSWVMQMTRTSSQRLFTRCQERTSARQGSATVAHRGPVFPLRRGAVVVPHRRRVRGGAVGCDPHHRMTAGPAGGRLRRRGLLSLKVDDGGGHGVCPAPSAHAHLERGVRKKVQYWRGGDKQQTDSTGSFCVKSYCDVLV